MPAPPEEAIPAPSPTDGSPPVNPSIDFSDLVAQMKSHGLIPPDPAEVAPSPIDGPTHFMARGLAGTEGWVRVVVKNYERMTPEEIARFSPKDQPDPITPAEAAEEMDDAEAEDLAKADAAEALADGQPGAKPTWGELFTSDEADRRFDLDFLDRVSIITSNFAKPTEDKDGDNVYKLANVPDGVESDIVRFLKALLKTGAVIARRYGDNA